MNVNNDNVINNNQNLNQDLSQNDSIINNEINDETSESVITNVNNNEFLDEYYINKNTDDKPISLHSRKRSYSLNINSQRKHVIQRSNSNKFENFSTNFEYEESLIDDHRDSIETHQYYIGGTHMNPGFFSSTSKTSLPQRYQRGQPNEKYTPTYHLSRTSRVSFSSSTTSQFFNRPRIVSGTTYGSDYNPSNTTYSIVSMTEVDYVSWRESVSTVNTASRTSINRGSILQDIHDEIFYLLKGTKDNPVTKRAVRKHFSEQYGSILVENYGEYINECVSEFYQDSSSSRIMSIHSTSSVYSINNNYYSLNRQYGVTNNMNIQSRTSLLNNISSQSQSMSYSQSLSQPLSHSQSISPSQSSQSHSLSQSLYPSQSFSSPYQQHSLSQPI